MERINLLIHKDFNRLFSDIENNNLPDGLTNRLIELRNKMVYMHDYILSEIQAKKKYGIDIDFLNADVKRIDLTRADNPYWLDGEISEERPPGPTNEEIRKLLDKIREIYQNFKVNILDRFREQDPSSEVYSVLHSMNYMLMHDINEAIKETFFLPNKNIKFTKALYDRTPNAPFDTRQNTPCEICGENRSIDKCHIIPAEYGGNRSAQNIIYLCPTHHRLFDRMMLTRDEWEKISWEKFGRVSANFAYYITKPKMEKFWKLIEEGIYEKVTGSVVFQKDMAELYKTTIRDVLKEENRLSLNEIIEKTQLQKTICINILEDMVKNDIVERNIEGRNVLYNYTLEKNNSS